MKKFAFINIPSQELERPPAAPALLSSIIRSIGWDCKIFDFNLFLNKNVSTEAWVELEQYWRCKISILTENTKKELLDCLEKFTKELLDYSPDWVGVSVFSRLSTIACFELLSYIRPKVKAKILVGGHGLLGYLQVTTVKDAWPGQSSHSNTNENYESVPEYLKKKNFIDHYILGDGEKSIKELLLGNKYPGIDGTKPLPVTDLDSLPLPSYTSIEPLTYYYTNEPGVYITMSKGCVRRCTFCSIPDVWPVFTVRNTKTLVDEIKKNKIEYQVNLTHFTDSLINGSMKHFRELNQQLSELRKDSRFTPIKYMGQFICRSKKEQTEADWELMYKGGASLLVTGFESYSESVRKHMGKNYSNEDIDFHFQQSAYYGIRNVALMFIGYPTETIEDHEYNKEFLYKFQKYAKSGIIHMVRWGFTGMFRDIKKIQKKGNVEMVIDPTIESKFKNLPQGLRDIGLGFGWVNKKNPDLTLNERIRRRIELHELAVKLGWPQTRSNEELKMLFKIMKNLNLNNLQIQDMNDLDDVLDFH